MRTASDVTPPDPATAAASTRPARGRIYGSVLEVVGGTPLVRLARLGAEEGLGADIALKLEFFNPLGSVKDRIGLAMVERAEAEGLIHPGRSVLVEPTSGNTGIALAFVAAAKGYRLIVTMPEGASIERRKMLRLMGADVQLTPARQGMAGAITRAEAILAATPGAWMPRQFDNPANPAVHAATTAEEIWTDSDGAVDIIVGGAGTGGTMTGIARALKPRKPGLRCFVVEPAESAVLSGDEPGPHGIQGIGPGFQPDHPGPRTDGRRDPRVGARCAGDGAALRGDRRAAGRHLLRCRSACRRRARTGGDECRQADRGDRAVVRRALSFDRAVRGAVAGARRLSRSLR